MEQAPFYSEIANGPEGGAAWWLRTKDNCRIRIAVWSGATSTVQEPQNGTVLMFCGRTEFAEKYGVTARDLSRNGYATVSIDWRGQGLADRLIQDGRLGHINDILDFQQDVDAVLSAAKELNLPQPLYLIGHSMGGCIGLRSLHNNLPVKAAVFSAPMWGIKMTPAQRPLAWVISRLARLMKFDHLKTPFTTLETYVLAAPFEDNMLTRDREMYELMQDQVTKYPALALGGPTIRWLGEALKETDALHAMSSPDIPMLTLQGDNERIVRTDRIDDRVARWPNGTRTMVPNAEHETLMEGQTTRGALIDQCCAFFAKHR
ncbi:alpha/beta fold hydrolase [Cochlodiniinecator piscidefendens]|uniref:alpha/beta fold hydrolase n=1 Tax=Cochlodiniinecator piscidefendens TaxID=2715756 RepID=UPI00140BFC10|nr:alpha/beta hydrolase [Cochlodiniinecator piscidefendens]